MTADEFRRAREALGLTGQALAKYLRITPRAVWYYQSGQRKIPGPVEVNIEMMLLSKRKFHVFRPVQKDSA